MANTQDTQNQGFPKLVWQGLLSVLLSAIDEAHLELNGWLSDANRKKYGKITRISKRLSMNIKKTGHSDFPGGSGWVYGGSPY